MSEVTVPAQVARAERYNCLDSWIIRGTLAILLLFGIVALIGGFAYIDARNNRNEPITIRHYPGMQLLSENNSSDTQRAQRYEGVFAGITLSLIADMESYYLDQMDSCIRLSEQPDPTADQFHTIVCQKDRSHEWLGFTQFTRLEIRPIRDDNNILTGEVIVLVNDQWED